jgi:putative sigma-54 modulation protein
MNVQITSRKFRAKDSLKDYIHKEVKHLEKYYDDILDVNVILSFTHLKDSIKSVEMVVQAPGKTFSANVSSDDFRKAVKGAVDKLTRQLKSYKTKRLAKKRV